jgi:hypothetical protein
MFLKYLMVDIPRIFHKHFIPLTREAFLKGKDYYG